MNSQQSNNEPRPANTPQNLLNKYLEITKGTGKLKDFKLKLHIDNTVQPITQPHRRIPFHVRKSVEKELKVLEENDIIEKISGLTPWISPIE